MIVGLATAVFWLSVASILWVYIGFPVVLALRPRRDGKTPVPSAPWPSVSYVIVVHNEARVIESKLANLEALDYPRELLQTIVASDGSTDGTNELVGAHRGGTPVELIALPRVGKNAALNAGVASARGEILVFSDADSMLDKDALKVLATRFVDPDVGGVGGDYHYAEDVGGASERRYWSLDRLWKVLQSRSGSMTSTTGQIYAIRRALFEPAPDGVTDDFFVSTGVIAAGRRLVFEPKAIASGPVATTPEAEFRRKLRLMTRGLASVWARRALLDPRRTGFYAIQLMTHKVARRLMGLPLIGLAISAPLLATEGPVYAMATVLQIGLYGLAAAGWALRDGPLGHQPALALPLYFVMVNGAGLRAGFDFVRGHRHVGWVPDRVDPEVGASDPLRPEAAE